MADGFAPSSSVPSIRTTERLMRDLATNSLGQLGTYYYAGAKDCLAATGKTFASLYAFTSTVVEMVGSNTTMEGDPFTGVTIPAGGTLFGNFSRIKITSGTGVIYYGTPR